MERALTRASLVHRAWRYHRRVNPGEVRWLRRVLNPGDVAVDAGAYKGGYTYWMRWAAGETGRVFAFEPQREPAAYLAKCVEAFRWTNVTVEEAALSSTDGARELRLPAGRPSPAASLVGRSLPADATGYVVRVVALDRYLRERAQGVAVRLVKVDVEGHEREVLEGAADTLERDRPLLLVECESRHLAGGSVEELFAHLGGLGYRGFFFLDGRELPVAELDVSLHQIEGRRPYVNNFAFAPIGAPP